MASSPQRLLSATHDLSTPLAIIDAETLWANADDLVQRADGVPIRLASKSIRVRSIIERTLVRDGFAGIMAYSLAEANWLVDCGADDVLLAYPTVDAAALRDLIADEARLAAISVMVDSIEALDVIDALLPVDRPEIRLCLDVDASLRIGRLHLGVRRSPVHSVDDATHLAQMIAGRAGYRLVGLMFYDAQIAGLPDTSRAVRMVKRRSAAELTDRRGEIVEAVRHVAHLELVNAGGTGSLEITGGDPAITELTAGSGLFAPTLFDDYNAFESRPAAFFALSVVRRPAEDIATVFGGGYIASGSTDKNRRPTPVWPEGLALIDNEGAGEVQTPLRGSAATDLAIGDRVLLRHAKAGEMCERFSSVVLVDGAGGTEVVPTYRGEAKNFG
ncbi:amino acid deaminase/aldolase [Aeromicrobium sp. CF3.5]|uniref:amino acid deaminase/aldolase n=1 Tax=Aeromicrobium sp. CF3.5 TaxID=3373078 RepID=UPI003EE63F6D